MLKDGITDIIQKYDIDAGVIVRCSDQIMYQYQAEKIFRSEEHTSELQSPR